MNKRYFLRGLGCGLIIGAVVMMVSFYSQDKNEAATATSSDAVSRTEASTETTSESTTEAASEVATETTTEATTEVTTEATTEVTTEATTEVTTEATTEITTETTTEAATEEATEEQKGGSITVTAGMTAQSVAKKLKEIGVIDDETDFYMYMYNNGYASKILQGTFTFTGDEDYEEIANILMYTR